MKKAFSKEPVIKDSFETQDIQLAATILALGEKFDAIYRGNSSRCVFVFEDSANLRRYVDEYWNRQLSIEPQALLGALKSVKSRLYNEL